VKCAACANLPGLRAARAGRRARSKPAVPPGACGRAGRRAAAAAGGPADSWTGFSTLGYHSEVVVEKASRTEQAGFACSQRRMARELRGRRACARSPGRPRRVRPRALRPAPSCAGPPPTPRLRPGALDRIARLQAPRCDAPPRRLACTQASPPPNKKNPPRPAPRCPQHDTDIRALIVQHAPAGQEHLAGGARA